MEILVFGTLAIVGISVGLALYRKRLEKKVKIIKKEAEKLEAEKAKYLIH
ncbi:MAG: hypothetical protein NZ879_04800 [Archaeoglobaceae archaeon]|nr:hypothetical protein [Archaeoglobaceae archaeon]MDW8118283.1 hypothetical protein [Archaeoglobaceae archaeon]